MSARTAAALLSVIATVAVSSSAQADVLSPVDGATVGARPVFTFENAGPPGSARIEVSRSPDVQTAGRAVGAFVDPTDSAGSFFGDDPTLPPNALRWNSPGLPAGRYFWHARLEMYDGLDGLRPWTAVRSMVVADEPPVFAGWTLRAQRLRSRTVRGHRCQRVRLRGRVAFTDNDRTPRVSLVLRVRRGGRTVDRVRGLLGGTGRYDAIVCAPGRSLLVQPVLVDHAGHVVRGPSRRVRS